MTYYTITTSNAYGIARFPNVRNLAQAIVFAMQFSANGSSDVVDQETGAIMASFTDGKLTYADLDPYAGY